MREEYHLKIEEYEPLWGSWYIEDFLGEGSYGKVYKIVKKECDFQLESAVKIITVPSKEQYRQAVIAVGDNRDSIERYLEEAVKSIANEIILLYKLRGNRNIVSYEDHIIKKLENEIGWHILIRMEYVKPLKSITSGRKISGDEITRLGMDMCSAIETCSRLGIVHRDIKEENIFISKEGNFKLGDFGIAREMTKSNGTVSMRGTPLYAAPEVFKGGKCDQRSDIYSLGIVLYKLLNKGRYPFVQPPPHEIKYHDNENAFVKRLSGEPLPLPAEASGDMAKKILKACAYNPTDRYSCAAEMKRDIEAVSEVYTGNEGVWYIDLEDGSLSNGADLASRTEGNNIKVDGDWIYL